MTEYKTAQITAPKNKDTRISTEMPPNGIRLTIRLPENLSETARRQKINMIYDILAPENS